MPIKKTFRPDAYHVCAPVDLSQRWYVYYYQNGKRIRISKGINKHKTAATRRAAADLLIEKLKAEHKTLSYLSNTERELRRWLEEGKGGWRESTHVEYSSIINVFCRYLDGREATPERVGAFLVSIKGDKHPITWNKYRDILERGLKAVGVTGWFANIKKQKASSTPARYFQKNQIKLLGNYLKENDPQLWLYVQFMFYTFIRPKELRGLKVGDILFDDGDIRVPATISKNKKTQYVAILDVFLPEVMKLADIPPGRLIFMHNGKPLERKMMYRRHKAALEHLEFGEGYTLYSWKHSGAVWLYRQGITAKEIMIQMRHHSLDQTDQYLRQLGVRDVQRLRTISKPII